MTSQTPNKPSHRVYAVSKKPGDAKGIWTTVGAIWPHKDKRGFTLKLALVPIAGAELVIREPREQGEAA